jgi:hypothetical protein
MRYLSRAIDWIASTEAVLIIMTGLMICLTIFQALDYHVNDLPLKWWLVAFSSVAAGAGLYGMRAGSTQTIRFWCGLFWALYGATRSLSWLLLGSFSGFLSWVPCVLLGLVVFARRRSAPYVRAPREHAT